MYSWSPTTTQSGSFLCTVASSTSIRVVTRKVRYIHELSLSLEHSMPISSPAAPGLTVEVGRQRGTGSRNELEHHGDWRRPATSLEAKDCELHGVLRGASTRELPPSEANQV